jgi:PAS domain S-box-containing protein
MLIGIERLCMATPAPPDAGVDHGALPRRVRLSLRWLLSVAFVLTLAAAAIGFAWPLNAGWHALLAVSVPAALFVLLYAQLKAAGQLRQLGSGIATRLGHTAAPPRYAAREVAELFDILNVHSRTMALQRQRIVRARKRLEEVFACAFHPTLVLDGEARVLLVNEAAVRLFGLCESTLIGKPFLELIVPGHPGEGPMREALSSEQRQSPGAVNACVDNVAVIGRGSTQVPCEATLVRTTLWPTTYYVLTLRNISKLLQANERLEHARQAAEEANRAKSMFIANMSHEIRTPINGIMGMTELALREATSDEQREQLLVARSCAKQLLSIVNDILDFSKIEAGRLEVEALALRVRELAARVIKSYEPIASEKGLSLELSVDPSVPEVVVTDPLRLQQILRNLLDNAVKFTPSGWVRVLITTAQPVSLGQPDRLVVHVADSGIGIPREKLPMIFDAFSQADNSTTRVFGGTGLGLSLSRALAHLLGGDLTADSEVGVGSVFTLWVDLAHQDESVADFQDTSPHDVNPVAKSRNEGVLRGAAVLLAEDNAVNAMLVRKLLQPLGATVDVVGNGRLAVDTLSARPYDLVLMDVSMPVLGGLEATREIRALAHSDRPDRQRFARVPIMGLTAFAMQGDRERCMDAGMDDYIAKPIRGVKFIDKIVALVTRQRAVAAAALRPRLPV